MNENYKNYKHTHKRGLRKIVFLDKSVEKSQKNHFFPIIFLFFCFLFDSAGKKLSFLFAALARHSQLLYFFIFHLLISMYVCVRQNI